MKPSMLLDEDKSFTDLAGAYVIALRNGENPSMEEYAARYPNFATEIRDEFPLILMAEQLNLHAKKETQSAPLPKTIGKYRITSEIGRGGMGRVYAATQSGLNREVAIKVVNISGTEQRDSLIRFQREAKSAGKLNHANIVPVYDYGVHEQMLYFVMPRIKGLDLSRIIGGLSLERSRSSSKAMAMDWRMVADVGAQVAGALGYAHSQGLIHRDIKPANLIMESKGRVWVTDFGLVKNTVGDQSLSRTGDLIGTPRYMAPEQLRGISDARSDIYGLGLTLYELATGKRAWDDLSGSELVSRRSTLELPPIQAANGAIPETLCAIIMKCCAFKPDDRYQTANEIQYVLNRYLHGHRVGDRRKTRNSDRTILKRRPIRLMRALATVVGIGIFATALYFTSRPTNPFANPIASVSMLKDEQVRTDFVKQLPAIIDQVVKSKDKELLDAVSDVAQLAKVAVIEEVDGNPRISEDAKQDIKQKVAANVEKLVGSGKLSVDAISRIENSINPRMIRAIELDWVAPQLAESGLSTREKSAGQRLLANLKKGIMENRISQGSSNRLRFNVMMLLDSSENKQAADSDTAYPRLPDNKLRTLLGYVELAVSERSKNDDRVELPIQALSQQQQSESIVNAIDKAIQNPEVRNWLNSLK